MSERKQTEALKKALLALKDMKAKMAAMAEARREPVAIVGMGCRFPGGIDSPDAYWRLLQNSGDAITDVPPTRFDVDRFYHPEQGVAGRMYTRRGGFLEDIDLFDAEFFGISPKEATAMDPQQRLVLEVAWEALENGGIAPMNLKGSDTGVFLGQVMNDYADYRFKAEDPSGIDPYSGTGTYSSVLSGRLSFFLGLQGPSISLDTACSTSLVSIHQAVASLRNGECSLALAGGVNLILSPAHFIYYCSLHALAPDGRCKTFDAQADGFVKSEGCGIVVLKRLSEALRDGNPILAVVRGSAVNHDGSSSGLTVPSGLAQQRVIERALRDAGVQGTDIDYVEAHGTGTRLGDPIEVQALLETLRGKETRTLIIGSVKTNIGHTESAAGAAGVIKTVLAMQHGLIPAHLHFESLNPAIEPGEAVLHIPTKAVPWPDDGTGLASVQSLGIGGTNAHVILGPAPSSQATSFSAPEWLLLPLSARSEPALKAQANATIQALLDSPGQAGLLAAHAARNRTHHAFRVTVTAANGKGLVQHLRQFLRNESEPAIATGRARPERGPKIAFVFPGQGSQWLGMGRQLMAHYPIFREKILECDRCCRELEGWSILAELEAGESHSRLDETMVAQPTIFAIQVALAALWESLGLKPAAVIGHSMGEVAAAYVCGALSIMDAVRIITSRSRIVKQAGTGAMAMVECAPAEMEQRLQGRRGIGLAAANGPRTSIVSGDVPAVDTLLEELEAEEIFCRRVNVDYASHGHHMDPLLAEIRETLVPISPRAATVPFYSTVTATVLPGEKLTAAYWAENLRRRVRFFDQVQQLLAADVNVLLEISPHPIMTYALADAVAEAGKDTLVSGSLRRDEDECQMLLQTLGRLFVQGFPIDWRQIYGGDPLPAMRLPNYPWQRRRYWLDPPPRAFNAPASERPAKARALRLKALDQDPSLAAIVDGILDHHGLASRSVGQATGKPYLFLSSSQDALIFFNIRGASLVAINYTGPLDAFAPLARELEDFCRCWQLQLNILVETPLLIEALQPLSFSSTRVGLWHDIENIAGFTTAGNKMRRLRYAISKYTGSGSCETVPYRFGDDPVHDQACAIIMDAWAARKPTAGPQVARLKRQFLGEDAHPAHVLAYLIVRDGVPEGLFILTPSHAINGYLLDMEFYLDDAPHGCMEYGIVCAIEDLAAKGFENFSLGITLGTQLEAHPGEDSLVRAFFEDMRAEEILNGDANAQFKNKFRPRNQPSFLCRPRGLNSDNLPDLLMMLGDPTNETIATAPPQELFESHGADHDAWRTALPDTQPRGVAIHPLLHRRLDLAGSRRYFESLLDLEALNYLRDHRVAEAAIMPAAGFIEMALAAGRHEFGPVALETLVLGTSLALMEGEPAKLQVVLEKSAACTTFHIYSHLHEDETWVLHAEGSLVETSHEKTAVVDLKTLRAHYDRHMDAKTFYAAQRTAGYTYGPAFQGICDLYLADGEALARVTMPSTVNADGYGIHPSLLDCCLQTALALIPQQSDLDAGLFLPLVVDRFTADPCGRHELWVRASLQGKPSAGALMVDLDFFDDDGFTVGQASGLVFCKAEEDVLRNALKQSLDDCIYAMDWIPINRDEARVEEAPETWLLLCGKDEAPALALRDNIVTRGRRVFLVSQGTEFVRHQADHWHLAMGQRDQLDALTAELTDLPLLIADLRGLDAPGERPPMEVAQDWGGGLLNLLHALYAAGLESQVKLWLVTGSDNAAGAGSLPPQAALMWGMGRTLASEVPEMWGGLLDMDAGDPAAIAAGIYRELASPDGDRFLSLRGGRRHAARLNQLAVPTATGPMDWTGSWLVTGGLGAIGLLLADWLVARGVRDLVLVSRREPEEAAHVRLETLRQQGAHVHTHALDVTDETAMTALFAQFGSNLPALAGLFHAAGSLDDGILLQQDWSRFEAVLKPKVAGTWLLHRLTKALPLRQFVLFSSMTGWLGTPGQANYAAANAWMDALAEQRRRQGLPATSIAWGIWGEIGLAAAMPAREKQRLRALGLAEFSPQRGLFGLERLLQAPRASVAFAPLDMAALTEGPNSGSPLFANLVHRMVGAAPAPAAEMLDLNGLKVASGEEREDLVLRYLRQKVAMALGARTDELDTALHLSEMGLNSLMVMELRNRIKEDLDLVVPAVRFFRSPNLVHLAQSIAADLDSAEEAPQSEPDREKPAPDLPVGADVDNMNDDEVAAMLAQMIGNDGGEP